MENRALVTIIITLAVLCNILAVALTALALVIGVLGT